MKLSTLFPRPLDTPQKNRHSGDCASVLGSLFVRAYFERSTARRLGWRGILPAAAALPAWSCRVAGSEHTFGILFEEEKSAAGGRAIRGNFNLFVFPDAHSPLLDSFPLRALASAMREDYPHLTRNFAQREYLNEAMHFCCGKLYLELATNGSGLSLRLEAPARKRVIRPHGIFSETGKVVVAPGGCETDYPAFRLLLPLFAAASNTLAEVFDESVRYSAGHKPCLDEAVDERGRVSCHPASRRALASMMSAIGDPVQGGTTLRRQLKALPLETERQKTVINPDRPVLHVLTGFLGAGKTTLLLEWLNFLHDKNRFTGVMQNEFGQIGLDALLLKGEAVVEELDEGCVCCSLADSLRPGLRRLLDALPAREYILETTGLANPEYVLEALAELSDLALPGLIITVMDAIELESGLLPAEEGPVLPDFEGIRQAQIRSADILILNKSDAVCEKSLAAMEKSLARMNGKAEILCAAWGRIPFARLDAIYERVASSRAAPGSSLPAEQPSPHSHARAHLHKTTHEREGFRSDLLEFSKPISRDMLMEILNKSMPTTCRIKGLVELAGEGFATVQYAAGRLNITPYPRAFGKGGYLVLISNYENTPI